MIGGVTFATPWAFLLLGAVVLLAFASFGLGRYRHATLVYSATGLAARLPRSTALKLLPVVRALRLAAVACLVVALSRPQAIAADDGDEVFAEGIDILLSMDVSSSMEAADFQPDDRITVAKQVLRDFIRSRTNDRIGLVVFAAEAYTQSPLTLDYSVLENVLDAVRTRVIEDGTAIGEGLATAVNRLRDSEAKTKIVILITDGENNSGTIAPLQATEFASELGIKVFTILVGRSGLVPFPVRRVGNRVQYQNREVKVDPELLKSIAQRTGGAFYNSTDKESLENDLRDILDRLEKSRFEEAGAAVPKKELFLPFVWAALLLVTLDLVLGWTRLRRFP